MLKKIATSVASAVIGLGIATTAMAAGPAVDLKERSWTFQGPFGTYDRASAQRGLQVYREVCASCHGLDFVTFRTLNQIGFSEAEIAALAAEYTIMDGPDDTGEMFERPGRPFDTYPSPFPNKQAAAAANGGKAPPELSLMINARGGGADYMYSLLTGYYPAPADFEVQPGTHYNEYYPGHLIAMANPLTEGQVEYQDGTPATVEQMAIDVTYFLAWAAEPTMEVRKQTGVVVMLFLFIMTVLCYMAYRNTKANVKTFAEMDGK